MRFHCWGDQHPEAIIDYIEIHEESTVKNASGKWEEAKMYDHGFSLLRYDNETPDGSNVIQIHNHGVFAAKAFIDSVL